MYNDVTRLNIRRFVISSVKERRQAKPLKNLSKSRNVTVCVTIYPETRSIRFTGTTLFHRVFTRFPYAKGNHFPQQRQNNVKRDSDMLKHNALRNFQQLN